MSPSEAEAGEGGAGQTAPERQSCAALIRNVLDRLHIRYRSLPAAGGGPRGGDNAAAVEIAAPLQGANAISGTAKGVRLLTRYPLTSPDNLLPHPRPFPFRGEI